MEEANEQIEKIVKSKTEYRKKLAALPFEEKIRILEEMQKRRKELLKNVDKQ